MKYHQKSTIMVLKIEAVQRSKSWFWIPGAFLFIESFHNKVLSPNKRVDFKAHSGRIESMGDITVASCGSMRFLKPNLKHFAQWCPVDEDAFQNSDAKPAWLLYIFVWPQKQKSKRRFYDDSLNQYIFSPRSMCIMEYCTLPVVVTAIDTHGIKHSTKPWNNFDQNGARKNRRDRTSNIFGKKILIVFSSR